MPSSSDGLGLSNTYKAYFNEWFSKILANSQARETHIHNHINLVANEAKAREENIREKAKAGEAKILVELNAVKDDISHL